jgi:hypothetical protein
VIRTLSNVWLRSIKSLHFTVGNMFIEGNGLGQKSVQTISTALQLLVNPGPPSGLIGLTASTGGRQALSTRSCNPAAESPDELATRGKARGLSKRTKRVQLNNSPVP